MATKTQLELAIVEYIAWFNHDRLHESLGDIPPIEFEEAHKAPDSPICDSQLSRGPLQKPTDRLTERRIDRVTLPEDDDAPNHDLTPRQR